MNLAKTTDQKVSQREMVELSVVGFIRRKLFDGFYPNVMFDKATN